MRRGSSRTTFSRITWCSHGWSATRRIRSAPTSGSISISTAASNVRAELLRLRHRIRGTLRKCDPGSGRRIAQLQVGTLAAKLQVAVGEAHARRGGDLVEVDAVAGRHQHPRHAHVEADDQSFALEKADVGILRRLLLFLAYLVGAAGERRGDHDGVGQSHPVTSCNVAFTAREDSTPCGSRGALTPGSPLSASHRTAAP